MTGQNDPPDDGLTSQAHNQAGHCPLTGRYFEPCKQLHEHVCFLSQWSAESVQYTDNSGVSEQGF